MRYFLLLFLFIGSIPLSSQEDLSEVFTNYSVDRYASKSLFQQVSNTSKSNFTISLGTEILHLTPSNIFGANYTCVNQDGLVLTKNKDRAIPMRGFTDKGFPVSMTIGPNFIYGFIQYPDYDWIIQPLYYHDKKAEEDQFISYKSTDYILEESGVCGNHSPTIPKIKKGLPKQLNKSTGNCYDVDYAVCSDYLMYQAFGSNTTNVADHVVAVTNDVNTLYDNEFDDAIQFRITGQVIIDCSGCDPWTSSTNSSTLLSNFRTWSTNNLESSPYNIVYDISTLWSDRNFDGSTIGLAYTSPAVCSSNKTNNVLENYSSSATNLRRLAAHELAHNFSTPHDGSGSFVMSPIINNASDNWSTLSINTIEDRYTNNGGCLTSPCAPVIPIMEWSSASTTISEYAQGNSGTCNLSYTDIDILLNKSVYTQASVGVSIQIVSNNTTANALDYELLTTSIDFTSSVSLNQAVTIRVYDDIVEEMDETIELAFTITSGTATVGTIQNHLITIINSGDEVSNDCCSGGESVTYGTYNVNASAFTSFSNASSRSRFMITASDLTALGLTAGPITQFDFYVQTKNSSGSINNFTIGLTNYAGTSLPGSWISTSNVYNHTITTTTGWNTFEFDNVFNWDGTSAIYVNLCFDNGSTNSSDFLRCGITSGNKGSFVTFFSGNICSNAPLNWSDFNYAPQTRIYTDGGAKVETLSGTSASGKLAVGDTGHFYSSNQKVIASVKNTGAQDIDCIDVDITTAGNGKSSYTFGSSQYAQKTFTIDADNEASYELTLYYTPAELATWGASNLDLKMVKTAGNLASANFEDLRVVNPLLVETGVGADNAIAYKGSFTGFSQFSLTNADVSPLPVSDSDIILSTVGAGLILTSPDGTPFLLSESSPNNLTISPAIGLPCDASSMNGDVYLDYTGSAIIFKSSGPNYSKYMVNSSGNLTYQNLTTLPTNRIVAEGSNFKITQAGAGLVLKSSIGNCYKIGVSDGGILEVLEIGCP